MAYNKLEFKRGGYNSIFEQIEQLIKRANAVGAMIVKSGDSLKVEFSDSNLMITLPDNSAAVEALESQVATLEADLATAQTTIATLEEELEDQEAIANGTLFIYSITLLADRTFSGGPTVYKESATRTIRIANNATGMTMTYTDSYGNVAPYQPAPVDFIFQNSLGGDLSGLNRSAASFYDLALDQVGKSIEVDVVKAVFGWGDSLARTHQFTFTLTDLTTGAGVWSVNGSALYDISNGS